MLILRISSPKLSVKARKQYTVGASPLHALVGKKIRLKNLRRSKSIGVISEILTDMSEVTQFGKGMVPKTIQVTMDDTGNSIWVCEKDILKVL